MMDRRALLLVFPALLEARLNRGEVYSGGQQQNCFLNKLETRWWLQLIPLVKALIEVLALGSLL